MNSFVIYVFYLIVAWGRNWKTILVTWYFIPTDTLNQTRLMFFVNRHDDQLQRAFKTNRNNLLPVCIKTNHSDKTTTHAFPHYMFTVRCCVAPHRSKCSHALAEWCRWQERGDNEKIKEEAPVDREDTWRVTSDTWRAKRNRRKKHSGVTVN